jgi:hypothetical protein
MHHTGIDRGALTEILDRFFTLRYDAIDRLTGLGLRALAQHFEHLFKSHDLALCLFAMGREGLLKFGHFGDFGHLDA